MTKATGRHMTARPPFERIVHDHGRTVLRVCRVVVGAVDADDAWSETFLAALRAYPDLPADANVQAWLVTIAHRKAIDIARAAARRAVPVAEVPDRIAGRHTGQPDPGSGPLDLDEDLQAGLASLSDRQRQCLAYHYLGGLPYAEIAAIIGGSADAARRAASDGLAALRRDARVTALKGVQQ